MCDTPKCCPVITPTACAAPTPRDTNNYYNRHHIKDQPDTSFCKGSCYCPDGCCCPNKTCLKMNGRYVECDPCCDTCCDPCCTTSCCSPRKCPRPCPPPSCDCCGCCDDCCSPCPPCCPPYTPPCRKPICYPPIKCCEGNECGSSPQERICYYPAPPPCSPKYCPCGSPNPCDCDLNLRRKQAICEMSPCCRRCGRKVYAAEKIMAANGAFHSSCFSCYCCHKPLEVTNVYENQGEIYCKQCYARYFGVTGYGYGNPCCPSKCCK